MAYVLLSRQYYDKNAVIDFIILTKYHAGHTYPKCGSVRKAIPTNSIESYWTVLKYFISTILLYTPIWYIHQYIDKFRSPLNQINFKDCCMKYIELTIA